MTVYCQIIILNQTQENGEGVFNLCCHPTTRGRPKSIGFMFGELIQNKTGFYSQYETKKQLLSIKMVVKGKCTLVHLRVEHVLL